MQTNIFKKSKTDNLKSTVELVRRIVGENGVKFVAFPEFFNIQVVPNKFKAFAEPVPDGETCKELSKLAESLKIYIVGGSIVEQGNDNVIYNTATAWNPNGELVAKFRKVHPFNVSLPGIEIRESDYLGSGDSLATFDVEGGFRVGLGICYDIRFEEMAKAMRLLGCNVFCFPGAFNMVTGPRDWELLNRVRAIDNQSYVMSISRSTRPNDSYVAYGHSMAVNPFGEIMVAAKHEEAELVFDIGKQGLNYCLR